MSQYKDQITGNVLCDIRFDTNKLIDVSNYPIKQYMKPHVSSSYKKFSDNSMVLTLGTYTYFYKNIFSSFNTKNFTISFWSNLVNATNHNTTGAPNWWTGMSFIGGPNSAFHIAIDEKGGTTTSYTNIKLDNNNTRTPFGMTNSMVSINTWHHYAITYNGSNYKMYQNGSLIINGSSTLALPSLNYIMFVCGSGVASGTIQCFDDFVLINNQILWTSNFTVPNYYLTGDHDIHKLSNKHILRNNSTDLNDYFDKAFIY